MRATVISLLAILLLSCTPARPVDVGSPSPGPREPETTATAPTQARAGQESSVLSFGDEAWRWVERLSWVVAILGIGLLVFDVRRGTHELLRQPKMQVGAYSTTTGEFRAAFKRDDLAWSGDHSEAVNLSVGIQNIGKRTAHNTVWQLLFPQYVEIARCAGGQLIGNMGYGGEPTPLKAIQGTRERFTPSTQAVTSVDVRMKSRILTWDVIVILRWDDDEELTVRLPVKMTMSTAAQ